MIARDTALALLLLSTLACAPPPGQSSASAPSQRARVDEQLTAAYARFSEAYRQADAALVAQLYTEDAFYLQPDQEVIRGRAALQQNFARFLDPFRARGGPGPQIRFEIIDRDVRGDLAYDIGYYDLGAAPADGKFIVIWKQGADGVWRIHADGFSGLHR